MACLKSFWLILCLAVLIPYPGHARFNPLKWISGRSRQRTVGQVLKDAGLDAPRKWGVSCKGHILPGGAVLSPMSAMLDSVKTSAMKLAASATRIDRQGNGVVFHGQNRILGTLVVDRTAGRITLSNGNEQWQVRFGRQQTSKSITCSAGRKVVERTVNVIHKKGGRQVAAILEKVMWDTVTKTGAVVTDVAAASRTSGREGYYEYSDSSSSIRRYGAAWLSDGQSAKQCYVVEGGRIRMTGEKSSPTINDVLDSHFDLKSMQTPNADRARQQKIRAEQDRLWRERMREDFRIHGA